MTNPTSRELATTPELALLTALQTTLELTVNALVAAHPELTDFDDCPWALDLSPSYRSDFLVLLGSTKIGQDQITHGLHGRTGPRGAPISSDLRLRSYDEPIRYIQCQIQAEAMGRRPSVGLGGDG